VPVFMVLRRPPPMRGASRITMMVLNVKEVLHALSILFPAQANQTSPRDAD
jgi:hypothetical protein